MNYIFFITFVFVIYDHYCEGIEQINTFKDYYLAYENIKKIEEYKCPIRCTNHFNNSVMVQTAVQNMTSINFAVDQDLIAIVYYKCTNSSSTSILKRNEYRLLQKLCTNRTEYCNEYNSRYENHWESIMPGSAQLLNVDLRLPFDVNELKIKTIKCVMDPIVFTFKMNNTSIDYRANNTYRYEAEIFSTSDLDQSPLTLSVIKYPKTNLAEIVFNIKKSNCIYGWHEKWNNTLGYKCFINIDDKKVEAGYTFDSCLGSYKEMTASGNWCEYNNEKKSGLCRDICYNLPNCSYLCAVPSDNEIKEGGYIMRGLQDQYPDLIGSGQWKKDVLPIDLILFNECEYETKICQLGKKYCVDQDISFSCSKGGYNLTDCLINKVRSSYWRCPADESAIATVIEMPNLLKNMSDSIFYKNQIMNSYKGESTTNEKLKTLYNIFCNLSKKNTSAAFNLPLMEKRNFASFLLKKFVDSYSKYSKSKLAKAFKDDSFYYYSEEIEEDKEEVTIPMSPKSAENITQFIKLELNKSNQKLIASFFQFDDLDIMDETDAIKNNIKNMKSIKDIKISPEDYENDEEEVLYKNSDMFSLQINGVKAVKAVKYKLETFEKVESNSWLYETEDVCGFLDDMKNWTWSREGCWLVKNMTESYCECDHLSNFAMLFSMREINKVHLKAFEILSLMGGIVNLISLLLFLVFVLFINSREKLRIDQLNIAACLFFGTFIFLCGFLFSKNKTMCSIAALVSQFLFLAAFVWKLILGINVVRLIASFRHQNEDWMIKYRWVMLGVGYSIPLAIVVISGSMYWPYYGLVSDKVCWIDASSKAFLSFIIPVGIIMAVNTVGLFFIANTLVRNYINTRKTRMNESNELIVFVQLLVSMGLTWIPAYFAIVYLSAMYMFVIFFPLQGLLMFLLVVVINKENREKVSSFFVNSYISITSKSTNTSEAKSISKSKSGHSKGTEESDILLAGREKSQEKEKLAENKLLNVDLETNHENDITKC